MMRLEASIKLEESHSSWESMRRDLLEALDRKRIGLELECEDLARHIAVEALNRKALDLAK